MATSTKYTKKFAAITALALSAALIAGCSTFAAEANPEPAASSETATETPDADWKTATSVVVDDWSRIIDGEPFDTGVSVIPEGDTHYTTDDGSLVQKSSNDSGVTGSVDPETGNLIITGLTREKAESYLQFAGSIMLQSDIDRPSQGGIIASGEWRVSVSPPSDEADEHTYAPQISFSTSDDREKLAGSEPFDVTGRLSKSLLENSDFDVSEVELVYEESPAYSGIDLVGESFVIRDLDPTEIHTLANSYDESWMSAVIGGFTAPGGIEGEITIFTPLFYPLSEPRAVRDGELVPIRDLYRSLASASGVPYELPRFFNPSIHIRVNDLDKLEVDSGYKEPSLGILTDYDGSEWVTIGSIRSVTLAPDVDEVSFKFSRHARPDLLLASAFPVTLQAK